jgi:hypothetical protein
LFALSAKTPFSPQNPASQGAFSGIIGGFNASAGAASKTLTFIPRQHQIIFKFFNWRSILEEYSTRIPPQNKITSIYLHPAKDFGNILYSIAFSAPHCHKFYEQFLRIRISVNSVKLSYWFLKVRITKNWYLSDPFVETGDQDYYLASGVGVNV